MTKSKLVVSEVTERKPDQNKPLKVTATTGEVYSTFESQDFVPDEGDYVEIEWKENKGYKNIVENGIQELSEDADRGEAGDGEEINRQSAVKSACNLYSGEGAETSQEEIEEVIERFANYIETGEFEG